MHRCTTEGMRYVGIHLQVKLWLGLLTSWGRVDGFSHGICLLLQLLVVVESPSGVFVEAAWQTTHEQQTHKSS